MLIIDDVWQQAKAQGSASAVRKAAVAYVTREIVKFQKDDLLIVNASEQAVRCGGTDPQLLLKLVKKGVIVHNCESLHAKVILFDQRCALIGSANMSNSSQNRLIEAAIITEDSETVSGVAAFLEQLHFQTPVLTEQIIGKLLKIPVQPPIIVNSSSKLKRPQFKAIGNRMWLVGVTQRTRDQSMEEDERDRSVAQEVGIDPDNLSWTTFSSGSTVYQKCLPGDQMIVISHIPNSRKILYWGPSPVLRIEDISPSRRKFYLNTDTIYRDVSKTQLKQLLKDAGYKHKLARWPMRLLNEDVALKITKLWPTL